MGKVMFFCFLIAIANMLLSIGVLTGCIFMYYRNQKHPLFLAVLGISMMLVMIFSTVIDMLFLKHLV